MEVFVGMNFLDLGMWESSQCRRRREEDVVELLGGFKGNSGVSEKKVVKRDVCKPNRLLMLCFARLSCREWKMRERVTNTWEE